MPLRRGLQPNVVARRPEPEKPLERCARRRAAKRSLGEELHAQGVAEERTLTEAAGELDCGCRVPDCLGEMLSAPKERRCEAYERSGSRERVLAGFLQCLEVDLARRVEIVVVGARECESNEDARSLGPCGQLSGEPLEHRPRASAVPGLEVVVGGISAPAANVLVTVGRREACGLLGELGGRPGCAARSSSVRCRLELVCHRRIGAARGEREVACPLLGIGYELCEAAVKLTSALRPALGGCGEERVGEANPVSVELDDQRLDGGLERTAVAGGGRNECPRWLGEGRSSAEGSDRRGRKRCEAAACELVHVVGHRQALARFERPPAALERAGKFEREEGVPTRGFVDAAQCRAGKHGVEPIAEKPVERAQAERPDLNAAQPRFWEGLLEAQAARPIRLVLQLGARSARPRAGGAQTPALLRKHDRATEGRQWQAAEARPRRVPAVRRERRRRQPSDRAAIRLAR